MEDILGRDPVGVLNRMFSTQTTKTDAQWTRYLTKIVKTHPINGSNAMTLVRVNGVLVVLIGEIHDNEHTCRPVPTYDILKHIVLKALKENDNTMLLLEGFPHALKKTVTQLKASIRKEKYKQFVTCLLKDDFRCQYTKDEGNLILLRVMKLIVRAARLTYPYERVPNTVDEKIQFFDIRMDLGMKTPFIEWDKLPSPHEYIRDSLHTFHTLENYMMTIPHPPWHKIFQEKVLKPLLRKASKLKRLPDADKYTAFFIQVPDAVALNQLLCNVCRGRMSMVYGGENHRKGVLDYLTKYFGSGKVQIVAESVDPNDGSCSKPLSK
jgi:hypothetical protein